MWIFCCGMPRSGSTVQYQLTAEIVESNGVGERVSPLPSPGSLQRRADIGEQKKFFVVKRHGYTKEAAKLISIGQAKAIYVYRDIRDVLVSGMNLRGNSFQNLIRCRLIEQLLEDDEKWNSVDTILVSRYETMVTNLQHEALRIARYLGIDLDESSARKIADKYSIERQQQRVQGFDYENSGEQQGELLYDPKSLLFSNHIQSGKSEQWRTALSWAEIALVEDMAYDWLNERGYAISQGWINRKALKIGRVLYFKLRHKVGQVYRGVRRQI